MQIDLAQILKSSLLYCCHFIVSEINFGNRKPRCRQLLFLNARRFLCVTQWLRSHLGLFYVKFIAVNTIILIVSAYFHFSIVNKHLVCCDNGSRMKVTFTMVNPPEKAMMVYGIFSFVIQLPF